MDQSNCPKNLIESYPRSTSIRNFEFYSRNRWTYKTHFFHFLIFLSKTNQQNELKFLQIIAIYILHYHEFFKKIDRLVWELLALKNKHIFVNNKKSRLLEYFFFFFLENIDIFVIF